MLFLFGLIAFKTPINSGFPRINIIRTGGGIDEKHNGNRS